MRGRTFIVLALAACGKFIGTDTESDPPPPAPAGGSSTSSSSSGDSGSVPQTADGSVVAPSTCITSRQCPNHKCQPDAPDAISGTCDPAATCLDDSSKVNVDEHCQGVVPCLGYVCVPIGIIAAPTGIFACGVPGDACTNDLGSRCCHSDCIDGKCASPP